LGARPVSGAAAKSGVGRRGCRSVGGVEGRAGSPWVVGEDEEGFARWSVAHVVARVAGTVFGGRG
jgi:hypothetical protein